MSSAASSEGARTLELFQIQNQEGPCLDCFRSGFPVRSERLDGSETRWPQYALAASAQGYVRALALPMRLRGQVIGALNLLGDTDTPSIGEQAIPVAQAMADVATIAILTDRLASSRDLLNEQLHFALESRVLIGRARAPSPPGSTSTIDRRLSCSTNTHGSQQRPLREVAAEVTATRPEVTGSGFRSFGAEAPEGNPAIRRRTRSAGVVAPGLDVSPRRRLPDGSGASIIGAASKDESSPRHRLS